MIAVLAALLGVSVMAGSARAATDFGFGTSVTATAYQGDLEVFYKGSDAGLWQMSYALSGGWSAAQEVPGTAGTVIEGPGAEELVSPTTGPTLQLWYGGAGGVVREKSWATPLGWGTTAMLPTVSTAMESGTGVDVWRSNQEIDLFYAGAVSTSDSSARDLIETTWSSLPSLNGWRGELDEGGNLTSAPSADVFGDGGEVDIFARTSGDGLEQLSWIDGTGFGSGWAPVAGTDGELESAPSAVVSADGNTKYVFYVGTNGGLWDTAYSATTGAWSAPVPIPGTAGNVGSPPAAVDYQGNIDVFYLSANNTGLRQVSSSNGVTWTGPVAPAPPTPAPAPVTVPAPAQVSTTTIKPTAHRGPLPRVKAKLNVKWKWNARGTRVMRVKTVKFPPKGRITVSCSGRRCPVTMSAGWRDLGRLWHRLEHHWFHRRDKVVFKITERGHSAERAVFRIRHQASPVLKQS